VLALPRDERTIERQRAELVALIGERDGPRWTAARGDLALVLPFVAALPDVLAYHDRIGVPEDVSWATLADLGRHAALYRRAHDRPGFDHAWWLQLHFRGRLFRLGRLQFEQRRRGLSVHVPGGETLDPSAVDASLAAAPSFFARHLPAQPRETAFITSWLLDPQLAEWLPPDSNIVRFQRRWTLDALVEDGDASILEFVFVRVRPLDELPQRTALERAVVAHLRRGGHWHVRSGTLALCQPSGSTPPLS